MADAGIDLTKQIEEAGDISKEDLDRLGNLGVPGMLDVLDDVEVLLKQVSFNLNCFSLSTCIVKINCLRI